MSDSEYYRSDSSKKLIGILDLDVDHVEDEQKYEQQLINKFNEQTNERLKEQERKRLSRIINEKSNTFDEVINLKARLEKHSKNSSLAQRLEQKLENKQKKLLELREQEEDVRKRMAEGPMAPEESRREMLIKKGRIHSLMPTEEQIQDSFESVQESEDMKSLYQGSDCDEENAEYRITDDGDEAFYIRRVQKWASKRASKRREHLNEQKKVTEFDEYVDPIQEAKTPLLISPDGVYHDNFKIPADIYSHLFEYQKTCTRWLWELHIQEVGGILGDEMGLGIG